MARPWLLKGRNDLTFDVKAKGVQHVLWQATRLETRTLPSGYTAGMKTDAAKPPLPPMPELDVKVEWSLPLASEAQVWIVLSTQPCSLGGACAMSRSSRQVAATGATSSTVKLPEIHSGDYEMNVVLDRNENLAATMAPDTGDGVAAPNSAVTVKPSGTTSVVTRIVYTL